MCCLWLNYIKAKFFSLLLSVFSSLRPVSLSLTLASGLTFQPIPGHLSALKDPWLARSLSHQLLHTLELFRLVIHFQDRPAASPITSRKSQRCGCLVTTCTFTTPCVVKTAYEQKRFKREPLAAHRTQRALLPPLQQAPAPAERPTSYGLVFFLHEYRRLQGRCVPPQSE